MLISDRCDGAAGTAKVPWVQNMYAYYKKHRNKFEPEFTWWQLGDFVASAIDLANTDTLQQLCTRLFVLDMARQVKQRFTALLSGILEAQPDIVAGSVG